MKAQFETLITWNLRNKIFFLSNYKLIIAYSGNKVCKGIVIGKLMHYITIFDYVLNIK